MVQTTICSFYTMLPLEFGFYLPFLHIASTKFSIWSMARRFYNSEMIPFYLCTYNLLFSSHVSVSFAKLLPYDTRFTVCNTTRNFFRFFICIFFPLLFLLVYHLKCAFSSSCPVCCSLCNCTFQVSPEVYFYLTIEKLGLKSNFETTPSQLAKHSCNSRQKEDIVVQNSCKFFFLVVLINRSRRKTLENFNIAALAVVAVSAAAAISVMVLCRWFYCFFISLMHIAHTCIFFIQSRKYFRFYHLIQLTNCIIEKQDSGISFQTRQKYTKYTIHLYMASEPKNWIHCIKCACFFNRISR